MLQTKWSIVSRGVWLKQARYLQENGIKKQIKVQKNVKCIQFLPTVWT